MSEPDKFITERAREVYRLTDNEVAYVTHITLGMTNVELAKLSGLSVKGVTGLRHKTLQRRMLSFEQLCQIGEWMRTGQRPVSFIEAETYKCTHNGAGKAPACGNKKQLVEFPFYPVDTRCRLCIDAQLDAFKEKSTQYTNRKNERAAAIEKAIQGEIPGSSTLATLVVNYMGGWDVLAEEMAKIAMDGTATERKQIIAWIQESTKQKDVDLNDMEIRGLSEERIQSMLVDALLAEYRRRKASADLEDIGALLKERGVEVEEEVAA